MRTRDLCFVLTGLVLALTGVGYLSADEPNLVKDSALAAPRIDPTFQGRTYDQWVTEFRTELDPQQRIESLKALVVFGTNGHADRVVPLILDVLDSYNLRASLMLVEAFDEGAKEIEAAISAGKLPEGFSQLGFSDAADLQLFFAANRGLVRLAPRATPVLVKYLEEPAELSAGRIGAMRALTMEASKEWDRLVPKLAGRDDLTAMVVLEFWNSDELHVDSGSYEKCVKELLGLKSKGSLIQAVRILGDPRHQGRHKVTIPLLEELLNKTTDADVKTAIGQALKQIPRDPNYKSQIVPASANQEIEQPDPTRP